MGQYYKPISIEKRQHVLSHDYDNGLKLMQHSWIGNKFVGVVEELIAKGGAWHGDRIVWAGDYADKEKNRKSNLYDIARAKIQPPVSKKKYRFVINLDTQEFVDKNKVPVTEVYEKFEYKIHPLPLLTCEGNGRGGGDYHKDHELVGKWARNRVIVANRAPKGFKEIIFDLVE